MAKGAGKGGGKGPSKEDVTIAMQMAGLISQMVSQSSKISASFETQAEATAKIAENMKSMGTGDIVTQLVQVNVTLKEVAAALQNLNTTSAATFASISEGALQAANSTRDFSNAATAAAADAADTSAYEDLCEKLGDTSKSSSTATEKFAALGEYIEKNFPVSAGVALGALSGLSQGFTNVMSLGSSLIGLGGSIIGTLFEIGSSIVSLPFKMLEKLTSMAADGGGGISELATATNNLRKEFGALDGPVTKAITSASSSMKGFNVQGLSSFQVFGNVAERMEQLTKLFSAGGPTLQKFSSEFEANGGAILGFQKGLGITDEQLGSLAERADTAGTSISASLLDMTKQATHLGKEFGVDFKVISKGMAKATSDFKSFGSMSQKQIGVAVTYFAKLGVQLDKVTGVMDSFNTFDDASEKVSTLNQVFGTNIDSMKMMNAENPAERLSMLQKEFAKAGISGEKLTRAQRQLIASNTGISEDAVAQAFSTKNQSVSLDKMTKAGEKAAKSEMTQTEALNKLGDAMDRVLKSGSTQAKSFFDAFLGGFTDGITSTKEFRELMMNIRGALKEVYLQGKRLGAAFVEMFPGVKDVLGGLTDFFNPAKFKKFASGTVDVFIQFFKDLGEGKASFSDLMDRLKKHFFDFFDDSTGAGQKLMGGFKKIMYAIQSILAQGIKWAMEMVTGLIKDLVDAIKNPSKSVGGGALDAAGEYMSPIGAAIKEAWPALQDALGDLFKLFKDWVMKQLKDIWNEYKLYILAYFFGPALVQAAAGGIVALMVKGVGKLINKVFKKGIETAGEAAAKSATTASESIAGAAEKGSNNIAGSAAKGTSKIKSAFESINNVIKGIFGTLKTIVTEIGDFLKTTVKIIIEVVSELVKGIIELGGQILDGLGVLLDKLGVVLQKGLNVVEQFFSKALDILNNLGTKFVNTFFNILDQVAKRLTSFIELLRPLAKSLLGLIGDTLKGLAKIIVDVGAVIATGVMKIVDIIMQGLGKASEALPTIAGNIGKAIGALLQFLAPGLVAFAEAMALPTPIGVPVGLILIGMAIGLGIAARIAAPAIAALGPMFVGLGEMFKGLAPLIEKAGGAIKNIMEGLAIVIEAAGKAISGVIESMAKSIVMLSRDTDPIKLTATAVALTAVATALAIFGGGSVVGGLGAAVTKFMDEPPIDKIRSFEAVQSSKLHEAAAGLNAISAALHTFDGVEKSIENLGKVIEAAGGSEGIASTVTNAWNKVTESVSNSKVVKLGSSIVDGVSKGVSDLASTLGDAGSSALSAFSKVLGINSPSQEFMEVGGFLTEGITRGVEGIPDLFTKLGNNIISQFKTLVDDVKKIFSIQVFGKIFVDVVDGIRKALGEIADTGPFKAVLDIAKKVFKTASPSKEMESIGNNVVLGMDEALARLPKKAEAHFDATLAKAKDFSKDMKTAAPGAQVAAVAPSPTAAPAAIKPVAAPKSLAGSVTSMLDDINKLGNLSDKTSKTPAKIFELKTSLETIGKELKGLSTTLPDVVNPLKASYKLIVGAKGEVNVADIAKEIAALIEGLNTLGNLGVKIDSEGLANKIYTLNAAAGDPGKNVGLQFHLSRIPHHWNPIVKYASRIGDIFAETDSAGLTASFTELTTLITALNALGDIGPKINNEGLGNKIWALNNAAGDPDKNVGLQFHLSRIPHHWGPIIKYASKVGDVFADADSAAITASFTELTTLITALNALGDLGPKINNEGLFNKIYALNMAAGDPDKNVGLQFNLGRIPHHWGPVIKHASKVGDIFAETDSAGMTASFTELTTFITAINTLGDIGIKINNEGLSNKIYALNMAAGDPDKNNGLQFMMSRIPHHWGKVSERVKEVQTFFNENFSISELSTVMDGAKDTMSKVSTSITGVTGPTLQAMSDMASALVAIDDAVSKTKDINLSATLKTFKTNFGMALGQKGSHVVSAKDVTINVSFVVAIDATKLEGAILSGAGSTIKDKINLVIGAINQMPPEEIGLKDAPATSPFKKISTGNQKIF